MPIEVPEKFGKLSDVATFLKLALPEIWNALEEHEEILSIEVSVLTTDDKEAIVSALMNGRGLLQALVLFQTGQQQLSPEQQQLLLAAIPRVLEELDGIIVRVQAMDVVRSDMDGTGDGNEG